MHARSKIPRKQAVKGTHTLHFLRPVPPKLARLIEIANLGPPDVELQKPYEALLQASPDATEYSTLEDVRYPASAETSAGHSVDTFQSLVDKMPKRLYRWLIRNVQTRPRDKHLKVITTRKGIEWCWVNGDIWVFAQESAYKHDEMIQNYHRVGEIREGLRGIARTAEIRGFQRRSELYDQGSTLDFWTHIERGTVPPALIFLSQMTFNVLITVDEKGIVRTEKHPLVEAVSDEDVEAARIRECKVCQRIFWAGRITQQCCSLSCSNTFRVRRHRYKTEAEKAEHKHRRYRRDEEKQASSRVKPQSGKKEKA